MVLSIDRFCNVMTFTVFGILHYIYCFQSSSSHLGRDLGILVDVSDYIAHFMVPGDLII